jgi:hypothetical protein
MKQQLSLAVLCLIGAIKAVNIQADTGVVSDLSEHASVDAYAEANRYIGANGSPIMLAQTEGHARIVMERIEKYSSPQPLEVLNLQMESCDNNLSQAGAVDEITHCPINTNGPVEAHMK